MGTGGIFKFINEAGNKFTCIYVNELIDDAKICILFLTGLVCVINGVRPEKLSDKHLRVSSR